MAADLALHFHAELCLLNVIPMFPFNNNSGHASRSRIHAGGKWRGSKTDQHPVWMRVHCGNRRKPPCRNNLRIQKRRSWKTRRSRTHRPRRGLSVSRRRPRRKPQKQNSVTTRITTSFRNNMPVGAFPPMSDAACLRSVPRLRRRTDSVSPLFNDRDKCSQHRSCGRHLGVQIDPATPSLVRQTDWPCAGGNARGIWPKLASGTSFYWSHSCTRALCERDSGICEQRKRPRQVVFWGRSDFSGPFRSRKLRNYAENMREGPQLSLNLLIICTLLRSEQDSS